MRPSGEHVAPAGINCGQGVKQTGLAGGRALAATHAPAAQTRPSLQPLLAVHWQPGVPGLQKTQVLVLAAQRLPRWHEPLSRHEPPS